MTQAPSDTSQRPERRLITTSAILHCFGSRSKPTGTGCWRPRCSTHGWSRPSRNTRASPPLRPSTFWSPRGGPPEDSMAMESSTVLRTTPWRHQREAVTFAQQLYLRGKRGAMIAAVMGTGKSGMTVYLCSEEGFQLILILCPLRVVQVWQPQFEMHSTVPFMVVPLDDSYSNVRAKRDEAERKIKLAKARGVPVVVVINYDSAWRSPFAEWALRKRWDLVVADE